jgi:hypothetical protein
MAQRALILVGDSTSHDGVVLEGAAAISPGLCQECLRHAAINGTVSVLRREA